MSFTATVRRLSDDGVVLQPRLGFADPGMMRSALRRVRAVPGTVGTITVDSFTRTGDYQAARDGVARGAELNGYPIVTAPPAQTRHMLADVVSEDFPVQVRHGTPLPVDVCRAMVESGLGVTEGGPVSYALPYGRVPLRQSLQAWRQGIGLLLAAEPGAPVHVESFGGCLLGQLCPPALLVAVTVLEAMFFERLGVRDVSLSYAQQTNFRQDMDAVAALRRLAGEYLNPGTAWHVVVYGYMGMYPTTRRGTDLLGDLAVVLALASGAQRLIVKTGAEASEIPSVDENISTLQRCREVAQRCAGVLADPPRRALFDDDVEAQARALVEAALELADDPGEALVGAFAKGWLDVPFCIHPDNHGRSRAAVDERGALVWRDVGRMPLPAVTGGGADVSSAQLMQDLTFVRRVFDGAAPVPAPLELDQILLSLAAVP